MQKGKYSLQVLSQSIKDEVQSWHIFQRRADPLHKSDKYAPLQSMQVVLQCNTYLEKQEWTHHSGSVTWLVLGSLLFPVE